jgi:hypothetical protein
MLYNISPIFYFNHEKSPKKNPKKQLIIGINPKIPIKAFFIFGFFPIYT